MGIIGIGDVHANLKNIEIIKNSFDYLFSTSYYKESDVLIFQGDVFDVRKNIDIAVLEKMTEIFNQMKDKKIYIIMGNHDMYNKESKDISSLNVLEKIFNNIFVVKEPLLQKFGDISVYMLPFGSVPSEENIIKADYILGHLEIYPFFPNSEINYNLFKNKKIFMGHQHKFAPYKTPYMGSFFTTSYAELDNQKHFLFIKDKKKYKFFENKADVLHLTVNVFDDYIEFPFYKKKIKNIDISAEDFNKNYKYQLIGKEKNIDSFIRLFNEKNIEVKDIKISVVEDIEESEEIEKIEEENINNFIQSVADKNNVFSIFEEIIKDNPLKTEIIESLK